MAADRAGAGGIALVITSLDGGGAERVLTSLARHWADAGEDVSVVTLASRSIDVYGLDPRVRRVSLDLLAESHNAVAGLARSGRRVLAVRAALSRLRPRAVVSFLSSTNVVALAAAAGTGIPVIACERTDPRYQPLAAPWAALRRALYPRAAALVVQTEAVATWARAAWPRTVVVPNPVERPAAAAAPGEDRAPLRLLAMGSLRPEKGFDLLVDAFARVAAAHPAWTLTILGEGPERPRLEARVRRWGLEGRVGLPGRAADPVEHLAAGHAFALSSRREGFPNALLEAMACGLPAVAFDCPSGPAEIVEHGRNGLLVPTGDVAAFAAALDGLLGDAGQRARLGARAREIADRLAPARVLPRWDAIVRAAAAPAAAAPLRPAQEGPP